MPIEVRIDQELDVVFVRASGPVRGEDLAAAGKALLRNPDYHPRMNSFWDLREMHYTGDIQPLRSLSEFVKTPGVIVEPIRAALLVGADREYGLARMYQARAEEAPVVYRVFRDESQARTWVETGEIGEA
jgi:hypothetical protein